MDRFADLILRHRGLTLVLVILTTVGAVWALTGIRVDFTTQELFAGDDPEIEYLDGFREQFGADDDQVVALVQSRDVFDPAVLRYIARFTAALDALPSTRRVESLTTISDLGNTDEGSIDTEPLFGEIPDDAEELAGLRARALGNPLLRGRLVAADRSLTAVVASLGLNIQRAKEVTVAVEAIEAILARMKPPPGARVLLTGVPVVRVEAVRMIIADQIRFMPLASLMTTLLLILLYRSVHGVLITMASVTLATWYTVAFMALVDAPIDILTNVLPLLVMVYGVADAVHLLGRIHEEARDPTRTRDLAIRVAVKHLGIACLLTSVTTSVGFGSLVTASMNILKRFGLVAAAGVMIAYCVTMVVVPLGASIRRIDMARAARAAAPRWLDSVLCWLSGVVSRRARLLVVISVILAVGGVLLGRGVVVNNYLLGIYRDDHPMIRATQLAEKHLEGVVRMQVAFDGGADSMKDPRVLRSMLRVQRWMAARPEVTASLSPATFIQEMHRAVLGKRAIPDTNQGVAQLLLLAEGETGMSRFVNYAYSRARIDFSMRDVGAQDYIALARRLKQELPGLVTLPPGVTARVTGTSLVAHRGINRLVTDLLYSLSLALGVIAVFLSLLFRSVRIGVLSLLPNVIPLAVGLGFMRITGMRLEPVTVMIYSIALGIAVDDTIHFMVRYREEALAGATPAEAVRATLRTAGRAMAYTSAVLIVGFAVTLTSNFPGTVRFGLLAIIILSAALVTDLLLTPACMIVFRPWGKPREP